jgi:uncharacterized iron-regulated membrane protein
MNRSLHRWISAPIAVIMAFVAFTGVVLSFQELGPREGPRPGAAAKATLPDDAALGAMVAKAAGAARAADPNLPAQKVELSFNKRGSSAKFSGPERMGPSVTVDLKTLEAKVTPRPKPNAHVIFVRLHSGSYFGPAGLVVVLIAGLALLVLSYTGLVVYIDMFLRRRANGKSGFFWK